MTDKFILLVLFVVLCCKYSESAPGVQNALVYLAQYGYMEPNKLGNSSQVNLQAFKKSLKEFQNFAGIPMTGKLDKLTQEYMSMSRCGVKDKVGKVRSKRYVIQGSKWRGRYIRYRVAQYSGKLSRRDVDVAVWRAFNLWSRYTNLRFEPTRGRPHIEIRFVTGRHGDNDAFDGPGGTLAHAFFPNSGGATHFDDTERWTIRGGGTDLYQVAAHEFGHALGLQHSQVNQALMAPFYKNVWNRNLHPDDIGGIRRLYGRSSRQIGPDEPSPEPNTPDSPPLTPRTPRPQAPRQDPAPRAPTRPIDPRRVFPAGRPWYAGRRPWQKGGRPWHNGSNPWFGGRRPCCPGGRPNVPFIPFIPLIPIDPDFLRSKLNPSK